MTTMSMIAATVAVFIVAALLYYQSTVEGFVPAPVAGRRYNPDPRDPSPYHVPADLSRATVSRQIGTFPLPVQRPDMTPGAPTPREAMAQLRDLRELDSKIMVWLDAASQKDREQPGSLTSAQLQRRVMLQARLTDVRDQLGTGLITDTWKRVADELMELRQENAGWQVRSPSMDAAYGFGQGKDESAFLTDEEYTAFFGFFNAGTLELQSLSQPDPLQKVRLQQLQVIRQDLMDTHRRMGTPPIKMGSAKLFLRQILKTDQPLPTLFSVEPYPIQKTLAESSADIHADLRDIQRKDPTLTEITQTLSDRVHSGDISTNDARSHVLELKHTMNPEQRAATLCRQIREAFPEDADALGCALPIRNPERVIATVCNRLRYSVPTVSPEQFNCP